MGVYDFLAVGALCSGLIALTAILGGLRHNRREREFTHRERMKALEVSRDWSDDEATARLAAAFGRKIPKPAVAVVACGENSLARKCYSTALWTAFWGFLCAGGAGHSSPVAYFIATATGAIGVTAVICGTILAARSPEQTRVPTRDYGKPEAPQDALDFAHMHV